jgi:hypothetical protein
LGFHSEVFRRDKRQKAKAVDIMLTKDVLWHGFYDHYDIAVELRLAADQFMEIDTSFRAFLRDADDLKESGKLQTKLAKFQRELDGIGRRRPILLQQIVEVQAKVDALANAF